METGVGRAAVGAALDWLFAGPQRPQFVLYAGFAGALAPDLHVGQVVVAAETVDETDCCWPATWHCPFTTLRHGRLLTVDRLVASAEDKCRLAALYHADAVDMEAAHVAVRCAERGVPFGCMRAISDDGATPLSPVLVNLLSSGRVSFVRVAAALLRRPSLLGELCRLSRDTRLAARQLAECLHAVLVTAEPAQRQDG
jgi:adenosylhomocysteine nucleosidase